jgi:hypothetical protein
MSKRTWIIIALCGLFISGVIIGFGIGNGIGGKRANSDSAIAKNEAALELNQQLGQETGILRKERDRFEEYALFLESNNIEAGRINSLLEQENSDLRINNRELTARVGILEEDISGARGDLGDARDIVEGFIGSVESGEVEAVD